MNIKKYIKNFAIIFAGSIVGILFGTWLSIVVSWIPLLGGFLKIALQIVFALAGGFLTYKIKKDYFTRDKNE